jgi:hypothetical protein
MWLMNELQPDDKTICNFRKDNPKALKEMFREFVMMCWELELYGGEVEATNGTKFCVNNLRKHNHNTVTVEKERSRIEWQIHEYLATLERRDSGEEGKRGPDEEAVKAALEKLRERKGRYDRLRERVA